MFNKKTSLVLKNIVNLYDSNFFDYYDVSLLDEDIKNKRKKSRLLRKDGTIWEIELRHFLNDETKDTHYSTQEYWDRFSYPYWVTLRYDKKNWQFQKIGVTSKNNINIRFHGLNSNYSLVEIKHLFSARDRADAEYKESQLKKYINRNGGFCSLPEPLGIGGETECFTFDLPDDIIVAIDNMNLPTLDCLL